MKKSLFNKADAEAFIQRIERVDAGAKPLWGKMNAGQMFFHCTEPLRMAHGEVEGKRGLASFLFGKSAKKKFVQPDQEFSRNLPTDPNFIHKGDANTENERKRLIAQIRNFTEKGPSAITKNPHAFFGPMSAQEWDIIQSKHLDHHLRQFGV